MLTSILCAFILVQVRHKNREWFGGETGSKRGRRVYIKRKEKVWQEQILESILFIHLKITTT